MLGIEYFLVFMDENHEAQVILLAPPTLIQLLPAATTPLTLILTLLILNLQIQGVLETSIGAIILMTVLWIH